jgi:hypothetical protein
MLATHTDLQNNIHCTRRFYIVHTALLPHKIRLHNEIRWNKEEPDQASHHSVSGFFGASGSPWSEKTSSHLSGLSDP